MRMVVLLWVVVDAAVALRPVCVHARSLAAAERAVILETCERLGYAALADRGATPLRSVQTAGGGAKNPQWRALREAMLGVPVVGAENTDAAFGAALLALREA